MGTKLFALFLGLAFTYVGYTYSSLAYRMLSFKSVPGRVIARGIVSVSGRSYTPQVTYRYVVDGVELESNKLGRALQGYRHAVAERKLAEIPDQVVVWYDPNKPSEAYLRKHGPAIGYLILTVGLCCVLGALMSVVLGCARERDASQRTPPAPPPPPAAVAALSTTFAPDVVGKIVPVTPVAGDYAMSLAMTFQHFVTTELRLDDRRTGVLQMTLAGDGTARACLGSRGTHTSEGQIHYEKDPANRRHSASEDVRLLALAGQWKVVDGVATIQFDHDSWGTCDLANARKTETPSAELRCIGVGPTDRVPAGSLACEASEHSELLKLGMPMTAASRNTPPGGPMVPTPEGRNFMLGAPGLAVGVVQGKNDSQPVITFRGAAVTLVENDYRPPK